MSDRGHNHSAKSYGPYEYALGDELRGERATLGRSLLDVQRDLRIKAAYIAAIENAKPEVVHNPAFIPGYVRSYARYLNLDPDEVYFRFCQESGFSTLSGAGSTEPATRNVRDGRVQRAGGFQPNFPMAEPRGNGIGDVPVSAIGSILVMATLVLGLGYGAWTVLQNIQRVQFAPIEEMPVAVAEVEELEAPIAAASGEQKLTALAIPVAATALADLYRQQELEVPIIAPRDGPIAAIDPDRIGLLAGRGAASASQAVAQVVPAAPQAVDATAVVTQVAVAEAQQPGNLLQPALTVVAERAAWIRVYQGEGTVIFERILETGETYSPPEDAVKPKLWAGNSGSVYVRVGEDLHGPLGRGTRAARDIVLEPKAIIERFAKVEAIPEVISQTLGEPIAPTETTVAIQ